MEAEKQHYQHTNLRVYKYRSHGTPNTAGKFTFEYKGN